MDTSAEKVDRRSTIEADFNRKRHDIEMKYVSDKNILESDYQTAVSQNMQDKREALSAAGMNPDGSQIGERRTTEDPDGVPRPQGEVRPTPPALEESTRTRRKRIRDAAQV